MEKYKPLTNTRDFEDRLIESVDAWLKVQRLWGIMSPQEMLVAAQIMDYQTQEEIAANVGVSAQAVTSTMNTMRIKAFKMFGGGDTYE